MLRKNRIQNVLLLIVLLIPSWPFAQAWDSDSGGAKIGPLLTLAGEELVQTRTGKDLPAAAGERHSATSGGVTPLALDRVCSASTSTVRAAADARDLEWGCRPFAERLPYHTTGPPAR
jgi:hypothetical protein